MVCVFAAMRPQIWSHALGRLISGFSGPSLQLIVVRIVRRFIFGCDVLAIVVAGRAGKASRVAPSGCHLLFANVAKRETEGRAAGLVRKAQQIWLKYFSNSSCAARTGRSN